jgi:ATP-binding cassette subfamily A (ABC1) protein 3
MRAQWLIMVLYGLAATLFAYCMSLVVSTPLAAFAATAGVQVVLFIVSSTCLAVQG